MSERRVTAKKKRRGGFLAFLVLAFVAIIAVNLVLSYGSRLETIIVRNGSEEDLIEAEGYIFRDQTIITAPTDGYLYCEATEDERVSSGEAVMYIYKNRINLSVSNELKKIEKEIKDLSAGIRTFEVFTSDTAKLEQTISQELRTVPKAGARNDMNKVSEIRETVDSLIEKRRIISGEIEAPDRFQELEALKQQKAELEKQYNIERTIIHSPRTGAFTSRIDGLEEKLSISALGNIDNNYIRQLDKADVSAKTPDQVTAGEPIGKIVNNFSWSVAAQIPAKEAEGLKVGDTLNIRFWEIGIDTVEGTISKITPESSGKVILVVSSNKYVDMIYSLSKAKVEFVKASFGGFRIPAKSLRMQDGVMGVFVIRSGKAKFIPVDLLFNGKDWIVVDEKSESAENPVVLKLYDELIISGKNIYDGKVVR